MKLFNFPFSVLSGIIIALVFGVSFILVTSYFIHNFLIFLIDYVFATLISGFVTSFLISKDEIPPNIPFFFKKDDTVIGRRIFSGVFSSTVFILVYFNLMFFIILIFNPEFRTNILFVIGFYLFGLISFLFFGITVGGFGGKAGMVVRDKLSR